MIGSSVMMSVSVVVFSECVYVNSSVVVMRNVSVKNVIMLVILVLMLFISFVKLMMFMLMFCFVYFV